MLNLGASYEITLQIIILRWYQSNHCLVLKHLNLKCHLIFFPPRVSEQKMTARLTVKLATMTFYTQRVSVLQPGFVQGGVALK